MQKSEIITLLSRTELFMGLADEALSEIADLPSCKVTSYQAGDYIFQAREAADDLMAVIQGRVLIVSEARRTLANSGLPNTGQKRIERITKGGTFGVSALIPPHIRGLSALSDTDSEVFSISARELTLLFQQNPRIGYDVLSNLVKALGAKIYSIERATINTGSA